MHRSDSNLSDDLRDYSYERRRKIAVPEISVKLLQKRGFVRENGD